jgi:hypothetical protein
MPVNLARLVANKATAAVDCGEAGTLHLEFYPARITTAMLLNYATARDTNSLNAASITQAMEAIDSPATILPQLLAGWDMTETDAEGAEQPVPCDAAHIQALGIQVQWTLFTAILTNQQQSASGEAPASGASASDAPSDATSPPTA